MQQSLAAHVSKLQCKPTHTTCQYKIWKFKNLLNKNWRFKNLGKFGHWYVAQFGCDSNCISFKNFIKDQTTLANVCKIRWGSGQEYFVVVTYLFRHLDMIKHVFHDANEWCCSNTKTHKQQHIILQIILSRSSIWPIYAQPWEPAEKPRAIMKLDEYNNLAKAYWIVLELHETL